MSVKRVIVAVVGGTVLLLGVVLLVLPGPAFLVIPLGLAILATEFVWARRWLHHAKEMVGDKEKARRTTAAVRSAVSRWCRERVRRVRWWVFRRRAAASAPPPNVPAVEPAGCTTSGTPDSHARSSLEPTCGAPAPERDADPSRR